MLRLALLFVAAACVQAQLTPQQTATLDTRPLYAWTGPTADLTASARPAIEGCG